MVFESIVVDVLNRFLGDYVENLNRSQLKLGIWGGDVVLENLRLKQNALEELDIPVQTVYGHLGKLTLKIPWKNLYGASVEATVERLFLIVKPNAEVKYDPEKEEKQALAAKHAELVRIEEAKKKEAEKDEQKIDETFVEKLVTQIIKNVQLKIADIHVRYEDSITNPNKPFALGVTLHNFSVHTTDENWKQTVIQEAVTKIYKILSLECLAVYWNPTTELFSNVNEHNFINKMLHSEIATKNNQPLTYEYVLGPITATAKLKLNPKPELDTPKFSFPKTILSLHMEELAVSLTKAQYRDMMLLADSMDRMNKGIPYRKYRPDLKTYRGNYKKWWQFAITCILEEEVRRVSRNWDWNYIRSHRQLCKDYACAYQSKLSNHGKASAEQDVIINKAEKHLDLLNLVVIRQRIEMEVERLGKLEAEARKTRGWFGSWWSGNTSKDEMLSSQTDILKQFQNAMTADEKSKLFRAIDYQENTAPLHLPQEYVALEARFRLDLLQVTVTDIVPVLTAGINTVDVLMVQRPSANAIRVDVQMNTFTVSGVQQGNFQPKLVVSRDVSQNVNLVNVIFETNPLDKSCDQRVKVSARPLQITYDGQTVNQITEVFTPPSESSALSTLQAAAGNKLSDLKEKSAMGMQYAVHQHTYVDIDVDIAASRIIVPQTGKYMGNEPCAVLKLGALTVRTAPRAPQLDVARLYREGFDNQHILKEITKHSYDKITLGLTEIQIVVAKKEENWMDAIAGHEETHLHLLQPTNLIIQIHKCLITDDPRLPKIKVMGELEKIAVSISEDRLLTLFEILVSLPLPKSKDNTQLKSSESKSSSLSLLKWIDPVEKQKRETRQKSKKHEQSVQLTELETFFIMKQLTLCVNRDQQDQNNTYDKFMEFALKSLELTVVQKTYDLRAMLRLESVKLAHYRHDRPELFIIDTPAINKEKKQKDLTYLFTFTYCNVNKKCPEFRSSYNSVEQLIELDFSQLKVLFHLECLQETLEVVNQCQTRLNAINSTRDREADAGPLETIMENEELLTTKSKVSITKLSGSKQVESIQMKMVVKIWTVEIEFATDTRPLSLIQLQGATAGMEIKSSYTTVDCSITSFNVKDLNPKSIHKDILKVLGGDVINARLVMYNTEQYPHVSTVDMSVDAQFNQLRIIFVNWFITSMLEFLNNFQAAQEAIIEASSQAADAARATAQSAYHNATKMQLNVRLAAPIIIIPENSSSLQCMLVDLGQMTINNRFVELPADSGKQVTVEELTLELENMKWSCALLNSDYFEAVYERKLLRPTSFKLLVKRNLSSWYPLLPDLDVSGRLNTVSISVGHNDYLSIMRILNQNLQEGHDKVGETKSQVFKEKVVPRPEGKSQHKIVQKSIAVVETSSSAMMVSQDEQQPKVTIKFCFTMDSFVIDLLSSDKSEDDFLADVDLARFSLTLLSVKGHMFSDNSMHTSLLLVDCTLDDMRPYRTDKITRYFERRRMVHTHEEHEKVRSMIDITYTTKNNDTFIDLRIFSFNLILAMDFMNKLAEFAQAENPEIVEKTSMTKKKQTAAQKQAEPAPEAKQSMLTVNVRIEQPDIILVESLEQKTCDALVLNMEMRLKFRQTADRMAADGGISGLQVVVRTLGGAGAAGGGVPRFLLAPAHVSLAVAQPPDTGMHVDIAVSDIKITVSPDVIALINRVLNTMASGEESNTELVSDVVTYDKLWAIKRFKPKDYWFLKTEEAEEALDESFLEEPKPAAPVGEICLLSSPSIIVAFEMDIGDETIPVLVMEASLSGQFKDWSSEFHMESTWAMQVSYYNISRAVWEPLIEPVEHLRDYQYRHEPWELKIEMVMRASENIVIDTTDEATNMQTVATRQPNKTITISSGEPLEITITNTGLDVLTQLGNSFGTTDPSLSKSKTEVVKQKKWHGAPYVLHNSIGLTCKLLLDENHDFTVFLTTEQQDKSYKEVVLEPGACVPLKLKLGGQGLFKLNEPPPPLKLKVKIVEMQEEVLIPVDRADKRYFTIGRNFTTSEVDKHMPYVYATEARGLISDIVVQDAAVHIYLRSIVQVTNLLSVPVSVYYMTRSGTEVRLLGDVKPTEVLRLPLQAVHTPTAEVFFSVEGFTVSVSPFIWRELQQEVKINKLLQCDSKDKTNGEKFYIQARGVMEQVFFEHTNRHTFLSSCYDIVLQPAVKLQNCLPVPITVSQLGIQRFQTFKPGEMFHLSHLAAYRASVVIKIEKYLDKCWVCTKNLPDEETELCVWTFESHDSPSVMTLDLGMNSANVDGTQVLSIYCPFWMLNKTGFTLSYRSIEDRSNVIFHPKTYTEPMLFSFRAKNFFGKKKAAIRIEFGEWSEKFPLDVPGSSGVIVCTVENRTYQVAVTNVLTFNSLTKMVIFTPFYQIVNEASFGIQYQEMHRPGDPWTTVEKNSTVALWPAEDREVKLLRLRVLGSSSISAPFLYTEQHSTCVKLDNHYGGLFVEVSVSEGATFITVQQYKAGHAPALLVNFSSYTISVYEKENVNVKKIPSMNEMLYAWDNPAGPQQLVFEGYKKKEVEIGVRQDGIGDFKVNANTVIYWVSFLDGLQRVVLFTEDPILASGANNLGNAELVDTEMVFSMYSLGLSLVNDRQMQEIVYISMSNSGIIWEQCKLGGRRYKKIDVSKVNPFEEAYQRYLKQTIVANPNEPVNPCVFIDEKTEVDFEQMRVLKPVARLIRRTQSPALWMSYGTTAHTVRIHARMHRLQIDQQLPLHTFPVVLAPVPPPRTVAYEDATGMKPFIQISIVERMMEHSKVRQYKYYKVLIQEFHIKVEMGLINALLGMFPQRTLSEEEALEAFQQDLVKADELGTVGLAGDMKNFYDNLHLSPLKVHVSFSLGGTNQLPSFVGTVLQSIGVTLTDMNDVVFKLSYYERNYEFLSQKELLDQVQKHYTGQAIKQLYVLVLGLDVIGNPYGLVVGFTKGVEDLFYEPFQGAIQGPGEFAEGLFLGVRSLVGHTVGGAAGAVSRITGAMGHGLAALSLDKDYQRRRRDNMNKPPANIQEGLARSGKGLVMGVVDGVTGVFTKPIEGARETGVEGFFKGLGMGAVGLVARPTAGVIDFAAGSLDAVKRAADLSDEVTKQRPPRYLPLDSGIRPYSRLRAEGYKIFFELEKGKFVTTDSYEAHVWVIAQKEVVMCTDKRLLYLEKNQVFGGWQIVWSYLWTEIPEMPTIVTKGVYIPTAKKKVLGMFPSTGSGKIIFLYDEQQKKHLLAQCERLMGQRH